MEYGIQLYSLRSIAKENFESAFASVAKAGYKSIEFAGFFGHSPEEVKELLAKYDLKISGTHTGLAELTEDKLKDTIAYHKAIGNKRLIVPGTGLSIDETVKALNYAYPYLEEAGIKLGYHNHTKEFIPTGDARMLHAELEHKTKVDFEIDTCWAYLAGMDVISLLTRLKDRITVIHLKDAIPLPAPYHPVGKSLGEGVLPVKQIHQKAVEFGFDIVVESEDEMPNGPAEITRCMDFLKELA